MHRADASLHAITVLGAPLACRYGADGYAAKYNTFYCAGCVFIVSYLVRSPLRAHVYERKHTLRHQGSAS